MASSSGYRAYRESGDDTSTTSEVIMTPRSESRIGSTYSDLYNVTPLPPQNAQNSTEHDAQRRHVDDTLSINSDLSRLNLNNPNQSRTNSDGPQSSIEEFDGGHHYELRDESLPDAPIYNLALQSALRNTKSQLQELNVSVSNCPLAHEADSHLEEISQQIRSLANFEYQNTRTIGFVGDSGVGKSSLINSLLNETNLARSNSDGSACTCVVTEYRYRSSSDEHPYGIEVEYMTSDEVSELLQDLLLNFRAFYSDTVRDVPSGTDLEETRRNAMNAEESLLGIYKNQPQINREFLSDSSADAEVSILRTLNTLSEEVRRQRPGGLDSRTWSTTAPDIGSYISSLNPFTRDPIDDNLPLIWPFVRLIRVSLRAYVLRTGLILADLPGLRDLQFVRVRATERYMRNCHEVFAITTISRPISDLGVQDIISRCGRIRPLRIVCTKSEYWNAQEAEDEATGVVLQEISGLRSIIARLKEQLRQRRNIRARRGNRNYHDDTGTIQDQLEDAEFRLKKGIVERRNDNVTRELMAKYSSEVLNGDLRVFCISNTDYSDCRSEDFSARPKVELSGIPSLRSYCQLIPAEAQFNAVTSFLENQVPTLLNSIRLWTTNGSDRLDVQRALELRRIIADCDRIISQGFTERLSGIQSLRDDLLNRFTSDITDPFNNSTDHFRQNSLANSAEWAKWSAPSYIAFCRKNGSHTTLAVGTRNWNQEIVDSIAFQLLPAWNGFMVWTSTRVDEFLTFTDQVFEAASRLLEDNVELAPNALRAILLNMEPIQNCIEDIIDQCRWDLLDRSEHIKNDTLYGHDSSYITGLMWPVYNICKAESGGGSDARRKSHMSRSLTQTPLFLNLMNITRRGQRDVIVNIMAKMQQDFRDVLARLGRDLHSVAVEEGQLSEAQRWPEFSGEIERKVAGVEEVVRGARGILSGLRG